MPVIELADMAPGAALIDHVHAACHVMVVLDGAMLEDGRLYKAGDVRVSTPDDRHFLRFMSRTRCVVIEGTMSTPDVPVRAVTRVPDVARAFQRAAGQFDVMQDIAGRLEARFLADASKAPCWLRELQVRCRQHGFIYAQSVQAIAREAGVSREHLVRSHQKFFGSSISEAVRAERLKLAYGRIVRSDMHLADIAAIAGFADQSHMTRLFSAWIGLTPGSLRARHARHITSVQDVESAASV